MIAMSVSTRQREPAWGVTYPVTVRIAPPGLLSLAPIEPTTWVMLLNVLLLVVLTTFVFEQARTAPRVITIPIRKFI